MNKELLLRIRKRLAGFYTPLPAPLSDSEIIDLWRNTPFAEDTEVEQVLFARMLLARYGIGETK